MKKTFLLVLLITVIGGIIRLYQITKYPIQLNHDEISQLYDAISIAKTGRDIYGNFLPAIFESTHDYKPPFYTYATALSFFITGNREVTVKIPGVLFGTLIIMAVFYFTRAVLRDSSLAIVASIVCAVSPFQIFFARKSFENVAGIFFLLTGFSLLFKYIERNDKKWALAAMLSLALAMYTYFSHAILIPMMLALFLLIYYKFCLAHKKDLLVILGFWIILILPLLYIVLTNPAARNRAQAVFITQDLALGKLINYTQESFTPNLLRLKVISDYSFNRALEQLDPIYLFAKGLDFTNQGPVNMGLFYFLSLPFLIWGIVKILKTPDILKEKTLLLAIVLVGILPSGLTFEKTSPHRSIVVFTILDIVIAIGLYEFLKLICTTKNLTKIFLVCLLLIVTAWNFLYFLQMYTVNYPYEKSQEIHYPFKNVSEYIWSQYNNYDHIIFDPVYGEIVPIRGVASHYYLGYYGNYNLQDFQKDYIRDLINGVERLGKIEIRNIDWRKDYNLKNSLLIGSVWSLPLNSIDKSRVVKIFYYYDKKTAFYAISLR